MNKTPLNKNKAAVKIYQKVVMRRRAAEGIENLAYLIAEMLPFLNASSPSNQTYFQ